MASEIRLNPPQNAIVLSCKNCGKTEVKLQQYGRCHFER